MERERGEGIEGEPGGIERERGEIAPLGGAEEEIGECGGEGSS